MANSLFAKCVIPESVYKKVCNEAKEVTERVVALLDCVESKIKVVPSDFATFVRILEAEPFITSLADKLVLSYG